MVEIDLSMAVLSIIREADNAPSFQTIANRGNVEPEELIKVITSLKNQQLIYSLDEDKDLSSCRFLTSKDSKQVVDNIVADYFSELAGEGRLYFAYGANMNPDQMYTERCPDSHFLCRAVLEGHRLVFNKRTNQGGGIAGLERSANDSVWGVVYCLPPNGQVILERNQNQAKDYKKIRTAVKTCFGTLCCDSYKTLTEGSFLPSRHYLEKMCSGAQLFGLPQQYLRWLVTLPISN